MNFFESSISESMGPSSEIARMALFWRIKMVRISAAYYLFVLCSIEKTTEGEYNIRTHVHTSLRT